MSHASVSRAVNLRIALTVAGLVAALVLTVSAAIGPVGAVPVAAGFKDHSYDEPGVSTPSGDKPQSKVWYTDGRWWGALYVPATADTRIHRYNATAHTWTNTGVAIDARDTSHADYLWDSATNSLYVASVGNDTFTGAILVFKLNYSPSTDTYSHDPDFGAAGVVVGTGPTETVTIARDSTGQLWVTFTNPVGDATTDRNIMINRSTTSGEDVWGTPFTRPGWRVTGDDISSIIAFGGDSVGVMWSDRIPVAGQTSFFFATHADAAADATWSAKVPVLQGAGAFAEDHINLKLRSAGSDEILAAVKTEASDDRIQLLRRNPGTGAWSSHVVVGGDQDATRPQVVVDATNSRAYVFFGSPEDASDGDQALYYKSAPLSTLNFNPAGLGTAVIKDPGIDIRDSSTSKHPVTAAMGGILTIASGDTNETYYHGWIPIAAPPTPTPPPSNPFIDIESSQFKADILYIYKEGITVGCTSNRFCPKGLVTRAQMATFLVRALDLPATNGDYFTDDNGSTHEDNINALAEAGITAGCSASQFCPNGIVARGQMATFLGRAFDLPATSQDFFTDDNSSIHEARINALAAADITHGCSATRFCPTGSVNREQMAAFLHRALIQ